MLPNQVQESPLDKIFCIKAICMLDRFCSLVADMPSQLFSLQAYELGWLLFSLGKIVIAIWWLGFTHLGLTIELLGWDHVRSWNVLVLIKFRDQHTVKCNLIVIFPILICLWYPHVNIRVTKWLKHKSPLSWLYTTSWFMWFKF